MDQDKEDNGNGLQLCTKNKLKCSKEKGHHGRCNKDRSLLFWKTSPILLKKEVQLLKDTKESLSVKNSEKVNEYLAVRQQLSEARKELDDTNEVVIKTKEDNHSEIISAALERDIIKTETDILKQRREKEEQQYKELHEKYDQLKLLLRQPGYSKTRRENNETTLELISSKNTTKYRRRKETKDLLEFVHGGNSGAVYGAWDYLSKSCDENLLESFFMNYRRGKFLERIYKRNGETDDDKLKKAVAIKYLGHLSSRRYRLVCKIQQTSFDNKENRDISDLLPKNAAFNIDLTTKQLSNYAVDKFVKSLDIGEIHQIPGHSGVARTVTALITLIADVNLRVAGNRDRLHWFNDIQDHFVVEFSDDGAPESKETTMTIGSLSLWNFGNRVRSRDYHYPLHLISVDEKNVICENIWKQHCDEMCLIESNVFTINSEKVTFEFQPSADQAWQCWAANVLGSTATFPSPYANVHNSQLTLIGGSIGFNASDTWVPPCQKSREDEVSKMLNFRKTVKNLTSEEARHKKELVFMAQEGYRQLGEPRIGIFANRIRPEPLHLEINNWQHVLNLMYLEAIRRGKFDLFLSTLMASKRDGGCGLKFVAKKIKEHYENENKRMNVMDARLIGAQAIALARHSYLVLDAIRLENGGEAEKIKHSALLNICLNLRDIGGLISKVHVTKSYCNDLDKVCKIYFNLFALFFPEKCQSTVWTLGYALPYHARKLYDGYQIGYGILSMQGKESLHSALKQQLRTETNRSIETTETRGKWHQVMRSSYVRNFYIPYHYEMQPSYHSHYQTRVAPKDDDSEYYCKCSRKLVNESDRVCPSCHDSAIVLDCAKSGKHSDTVMKSLKPLKCSICVERFADGLMLDRHVKEYHSYSHALTNKEIMPSKMTSAELKKELKNRNKSTTGSKDVLQRRLEGLL